MKKVWTIGVALLLFLVIGVSMVSAQENGSVRGSVYQDVNGDGKCVNTGVSGEVPVAGVNLEFMNTGNDWKVTLYSGDNGTYGLVAAGFGYWRVTAQPNSEWYVTSTNPVYAAIDKDKPLALNVDFCVARLYSPIIPVYPIYPGLPLPPVLPESGAAANSGSGAMGTAVFAFIGLGLVAAGIGLEWQRRRTA